MLDWKAVRATKSIGWGAAGLSNRRTGEPDADTALWYHGEAKGGSAYMDWLTAMNRALDYLEDCLEEPFDVEQAARLALSSRFHFQRMFYMLCGMTVQEYLRGRRLTLAAQQLALGRVRVLDIALRYGYETPEAFAKAFRRFHGVTPSAARKPGVGLRAMNRLRFQVSVKGETNMEYRIERKDAFALWGKAITVTPAEAAVAIPKFWTDCREDGTAALLSAKPGQDTFYGVCLDIDADTQRFRYAVAARAGEGACPAELEVFTIPAQTYAVFAAVGELPRSLQSLTERVYSEWFPASGFEHAEGPELEIYPAGDLDGKAYRCELWVPVAEKA